MDLIFWKSIILPYLFSLFLKCYSYKWSLNSFYTYYLTLKFKVEIKINSIINYLYKLKILTDICLENKKTLVYLGSKMGIQNSSASMNWIKITKRELLMLNLLW